MTRTITVGIDIGTTATRVAVLEWQKDAEIPKVIGTGAAESKGVRHGYITDTTLAAGCIKKAVAAAEQSAGIRIRRAVLALSGIGVASELAVGSAVIAKPDGEITALDITKAVNEAEEQIDITNRKIIYASPTLYRLDGKEIVGRPIGMHGVKLDVRTLFVTVLSQHLEDLLSAASEAGVEAIDVIPSALAGGMMALSEKQKIAGSLLIDIGAEETSLAVFENNVLVGLAVGKIGSADITNDIALGLKISLEEAEAVKIESMITNHSRKKLDEIIDARLSDIFELADAYLRKIKRSGLLPAGVTAIGGGSSLPKVAALAKEYLGLPARLGAPDGWAGDRSKIKDSSWFVAFGLALSVRGASGDAAESQSFKKSFGGMKKSLKSLFNQFLP